MAAPALWGREEVLRNLKRALDRVREGARAGLEEAGRLIEERSRARTPVATGALRDSAYTAAGETAASDPAVEVGYTAAYAAFVHEDLEARHETGEAKFLERAVQESEDDVVRIVRERARIP